jgi:hypothetical protein
MGPDRRHMPRQTPRQTPRPVPIQRPMMYKTQKVGHPVVIKAFGRITPNKKVAAKLASISIDRRGFVRRISCAKH